MKPAKKKGASTASPKNAGKAISEIKTNFSLGKYLPLLLLAGSVIFIVLCRLRLLGVPLERDEGEYAYVAQQLLQGIPPFVSIYHVKLPGMYGAYAVIMTLFGQTCEGIHLGLLVADLLSCIPMYLIAKRLFNPTAAAYAASVFFIMTISQSLLGFSANSEPFILLTALPGILLLLYGIDLLSGAIGLKAVPIFLLSGILMGLAYVVKQNAVFFILFAGIYFLYKALTIKPVNWIKLLLYGFVWGLGVILPLALTCLIFWKLGLFEKFWWWTWIYPRIYVAAMPWEYGKMSLEYAMKGIGAGAPGIWAVFWPLVALSVWGLIGILSQRSMDRKVFVIGLLIASAIAITVGLNFYAHYFILATPVIAILVAAGCDSLLFFQQGRGKGTDSIYPGFIVLFVAIILVVNCEKTYLFEMDGSAVSHASYGANPFPEAMEIGKFLEQNTTANDKILVLGSEPEIYFYANRKSVTGFVYMYEIYKHHPYAHHFQEQLAAEIDSSNPKYIVMANLDASWFSGFTDRSDTFLFNWAARYEQRHYSSVSTIDLLWPRPDMYCTDGPQAPCVPLTKDLYIQIYVRKKD